MRSLIFSVAFLAGCSNSGTGGGGGDDTDASTDGVMSSDDGHPSDGRTPDGPSVSYAPCDTCCDPIAQNCPTGQACYENGASNGTYCDAVGIFGVGHTCSLGPDPNTHCIKGDTCLASGVNQCRAFCVTSADCPDTVHPTCVLYTVEAGRTPYGICF